MKCYEDLKKIQDLPVYEIIDPVSYVKCCYCNKFINKEKEKYITISEKRFAHEGCFAVEEKREKTEEEKLDLYIIKLFNYEYVPPRMKKQIKQYTEEYGYSYSGILKTLKYFYEIKGNSITEAHDTISIVPYVYKQAFNYFKSLWEAEQYNNNLQLVNLVNYKPQEIEVVIKRPQRNISKRKFFSFLD